MSALNATRYLLVLTLIGTFIEATSQNCSSTFDCGGRYCCVVSVKPFLRACSNYCIGKACRHHNDCVDTYEMCCHNNVCTKDGKRCGCQYIDDPMCSQDNKYCCKIRGGRTEIKRCKQKCENHPCSSDYDCAKNECCNFNNVCSSHCPQPCNIDSDCEHGLTCCHHKVNFKKETIKLCKHTCTTKTHCLRNTDCTLPNQCCGSNEFCEDCSNSSTSQMTATKQIIIFCLVVCIIIFIAIALICYCRKKGRCVFLKPRLQEEPFELRNESGEEDIFPLEQDNPSDHNIPPPPYSIVDRPFDSTQINREFPPIYRPQQT